MKRCPKCGGIYADDMLKCSNCMIDLVSEDKKPSEDTASTEIKQSLHNPKYIAFIALFWSIIILLSFEFPNSENNWKFTFSFLEFVLMAILPTISSYIYVVSYREKKLRRDSPDEYMEKQQSKREKEEYYTDFHEAEKRKQNIIQGEYSPKCPICQSTNLSKISTTKKVAKIAAFGIFGMGDNGKTWKCNSCGSKF